jgi:hypothetical protein
MDHHAINNLRQQGGPTLICPAIRLEDEHVPPKSLPHSFHRFTSSFFPKNTSLQNKKVAGIGNKKDLLSPPNDFPGTCHRTPNPSLLLRPF